MSLGLSGISFDLILLKISSGSVSYFGPEKWAQEGYVTQAWLPKFVKNVAVICVSICLSSIVWDLNYSWTAHSDRELNDDRRQGTYIEETYVNSVLLSLMVCTCNLHGRLRKNPSTSKLWIFNNTNLILRVNFYIKFVWFEHFLVNLFKLVYTGFEFDGEKEGPPF